MASAWGTGATRLALEVRVGKWRKMRFFHGQDRVTTLELVHSYSSACCAHRVSCTRLEARRLQSEGLVFGWRTMRAVRVEWNLGLVGTGDGFMAAAAYPRSVWKASLLVIVCRLSTPAPRRVSA